MQYRFAVPFGTLSIFSLLARQHIFCALWMNDCGERCNFLNSPNKSLLTAYNKPDIYSKEYAHKENLNKYYLLQILL